MAMARDTELAVYFSCQHHVLSMPTRRIERLVLHDEVRVCRSRSSSVAVPVVEANGRRYASWNLGRMLELKTTRGAWVLLRVTYEGAELPLALGVDACLLVGPPSVNTPLPPGLFRERQSSLWACFSPSAVNAKLPGVAGLCLDPLRLWARLELEQSAAALASALEPAA
jgi:hypothetical protein